MGRRLQPHSRRGRYVKATTENTLGLSVYVCQNAACRRLNPVPAGAGKPEKCHACGGGELR